jgi:hypothetical protein
MFVGDHPGCRGARGDAERGDLTFIFATIESTLLALGLQLIL